MTKIENKLTVGDQIVIYTLFLLVRQTLLIFKIKILKFSPKNKMKGVKIKFFVNF